jgi:ATP-binding protein involved in chromosome partitioning
VAELAAVRRIIAVGSGKGGVGKTTVAGYLAVALARRKRTVGLFDADLYGPNVTTLFGVASTATGDPWMPVARAGRQPYIKPVRAHGVSIMSLGMVIPEGRAARPAPELIGQLAQQTMRDVDWGRLDYLLIDMPPGTGEPQRTLLQALDVEGFIVVTTASQLSIADCEREVDWIVREGGVVLGVVENLAHVQCPSCGEHIALFEGDVSSSSALSRYPLLARLPWSAGAARPMSGEAEPALAPEFDRIAAWLEYLAPDER